MLKLIDIGFVSTRTTKHRNLYEIWHVMNLIIIGPFTTLTHRNVVLFFHLEKVPYSDSNTLYVEFTMENLV